MNIDPAVDKISIYSKIEHNIDNIIFSHNIARKYIIIYENDLEVENSLILGNFIVMVTTIDL